MSERTYFDDALPRFAKLVLELLGDDALARNLFLRDASGLLTFVDVAANLRAEDKELLAERAIAEISPYVDTQGFAIATPSELFDQRLADLKNARRLPVQIGTELVYANVVDRRMVGADWMQKPTAAATGPLRAVFASLKGGVGRSTALCVAAAHLSSRGHRVLAIDLDLEAPGLGNMLLSPGTLPSFGLLDYLVEQGVGSTDEAFLADMVAPSWLGGGRGRVDVLPAIGARSLASPSNVLGKIARAYLSSTSEDGGLTFADHMRTVVGFFSDPLRYDAILIDARAGLHETTAAAVVGLGAEVFFFGIDQPQTFSGYELLLAHLGILEVQEDDDWRDRLRFIQAKAPESQELRRRFAMDMIALQRKNLWPESSVGVSAVDLASLKDTFLVEWSDIGPIPPELESGPLEVLSVLDDTRYKNFDPLEESSLLDTSVYGATYGEFLAMLEDMLG